MNVAQYNMEEHGDGNPKKGHLKIHKSCEIIDFVAEKERPKAEIQPEDPVT